MDRKLFDELTKQTVEQRQKTFDAYVDNVRTQKETKFVTAFYTLLKYMGVSQEDRDRFYQRHMMEFRELLVKPGSFDNYLNKALAGFDVFGLGFTLMFKNDDTKCV
jgi:hypothetical protein